MAGAKTLPIIERSKFTVLGEDPSNPFIAKVMSDFQHYESDAFKSGIIYLDPVVIVGEALLKYAGNTQQYKLGLWAQGQVGRASATLIRYSQDESEMYPGTLSNQERIGSVAELLVKELGGLASEAEAFRVLVDNMSPISI